MWYILLYRERPKEGDSKWVGLYSQYVANIHQKASAQICKKKSALTMRKAFLGELFFPLSSKTFFTVFPTKNVVQDCVARGLNATIE